ncbi:antitoxin VapB family protein [Candidatus Woesearchaeota archaeon]|nr:antitoxin VapB family protein [Candidatus Woesearchaeota archaeon]
MTKVISLSNAAYDEIKSLKEGDDSFSDVVLRLAGSARKKPLIEFFGTWPGTREEAEKIKKELARERKTFKTREVTF